jgi:hypothetical protein
MFDLRTVLSCVYDATGMSHERVVNLFLALTITGSLFLAYRFGPQRSIHLPPGPPGDPILGQLRYVPLSYSWILFAEWAKKYGEIFYMHICGQPMIVLSTFAVARDLMEKRGRNYSDRTRQVMHSELYVLMWSFMSGIN